MNKVYSIVWNPVRGAWIVVGEYARRRRKRAGAGRRGWGGGLALAALLLVPPGVWAELPTGGEIVLGRGEISRPGAQHLHITQASERLAIDWQRFDIGEGARVSFQQPSAQSIALNRVLGAEGSRILGRLEANGRVFLINPHGVLFGKTAQVDVGGLVASTLDIATEDFAAGEYRFHGSGAPAAVVNQGRIRAAEGGVVALLGGQVSNEGVIAARRGTVALASGNRITLDFAGDGLLRVEIDEATRDALVANHQLIEAEGGEVLMSARAAEALLRTVVNNTGVVEARTLAERNGRIVLLGEGGTVEVAGRLDASAPAGGDGGFVETSGLYVKIHPGTEVTTRAAQGRTGEWLIDPTDFVISAGDAAETESGIGADTLSNNLESNNVRLATAADGAERGDIYVNGAVSWTAGHTLTLSAHGDIYINQPISAASGKLALEYGQGADNGADYHVNAPITLAAGKNFSTKLGSDGEVIEYTVITELGEAGSSSGADLQGIRGKLDGFYALGADIDASATGGWNGGAGFAPIGSLAASFTGRLHGLGHVIRGLTINRPEEDYVGLFGRISGGEIRDLGLEGGSVTGSLYVGGLVGVNTGNISHAYATGAVSGDSWVGGLVGYNYGGDISYAYATGEVSGGTNVGGLVGMNTGNISHAYATGAVSGDSWVGGLVGVNYGGSISHAYATGEVSGGTNVGGLVGRNQQGNISHAYATGAVKGDNDYVGGLVGRNQQGNISHAYATGAVKGDNDYVGGLVGVNTGNISHAYATGAVSGDFWVGGLVGYNYDGDISYAYATGEVSGGTNVGGLVGWNDGGSISTSFWDADSTGVDSGVGSTTVPVDVASVDARNRYNKRTYEEGGFDFSKDWFLIDGATRPFLRAEYSTEIRNVHQLQLMALDLEANYRLAADIDARLADGSDSSGMWSARGFVPIGSLTASFAGRLDGQGHVIRGLTINRPEEDGVGLFGRISGGEIRDLGLEGGSVTGSSYVGGLVGYNYGGDISHAYATGAVKGGNEYVGGLVGVNTGNISHAYATGAVSGGTNVGGLVGYNNGGDISYAYATGAVSGDSWVGGLVGYNDGGNISHAYATGAVSGDSWVGGLVGGNYGGSISHAYATGAVKGDNDYVGGLVGYNYGGDISHAYATGEVSGGIDVGGLVGWNTGNISHAYATGAVSGGTNVGGLVGRSDGSISASFYATTDKDGNSIDVDHSGNELGTGKSWEELTRLETFTEAGWNIDDRGGTGAAWRIYEGYTTPLLRAFLTPFTVDAQTITSTYNGTVEHALSEGQYSHATPTLSLFVDSGNVRYRAPSRHVDDYGVEELTLAGLYSDQQGYDIILRSGGLTITPYEIRLSGSRVYDGRVEVEAEWLSLGPLVGDETLTLTGYGVMADKHAGTGKALDLGTLTLGDGENGGLARNYVFAAAGHTVDITPARLVISTEAVEKTYDGTTEADGRVVYLEGTQLFGDDELREVHFAFEDKNAGEQKTVLVSDAVIADGNGGNNYDVTYVANTESVIRPYEIRLSGSRVYDGRVEVEAEWLSLGPLVGDETLTLTGYGVMADKHAGTGKALDLGTLTLGDGENGGLARNYEFAAAGHTVDITPRPLQVIADDQHKYQGQPDPELTWRFGAAGPVAGDRVEEVIAGALTREAGEAPGEYVIGRGELRTNADYALEFVAGVLRIEPAGVLVRLGERAGPYQAALVAALEPREGREEGGEPDAPPPLYTIVDGGLRLPEGL